MAATLPKPDGLKARLLAEIEAKSGIRKADLPEKGGWRLRVGQAIERTRQLSGLLLKEFAAAIGRDERQVARWISGEERPQLDAIFAVPELRQFLIIALAEKVGGVDITTQIQIRRTA